MILETIGRYVNRKETRVSRVLQYGGNSGPPHIVPHDGDTVFDLQGPEFSHETP